MIRRNQSERPVNTTMMAIPEGPVVVQKLLDVWSDPIRDKEVERQVCNCNSKCIWSDEDILTLMAIIDANPGMQLMK